MKPCPWCGTCGQSLFELWDAFDGGYIAYVHCSRCGANGPSCYSEPRADEAIAQAWRRWNASGDDQGCSRGADFGGELRECRLTT
jgi:hypothetical protein